MSKIEILGYTPDNHGDYDEHDTCGLTPRALYDGAQMVFDAAGIRIMRNMEVNLLAVKEGKVIGATVCRTYSLDADRAPSLVVTPGGWIAQPPDPLVYDFDIAVHPDHQRGVVGYLLTQANMREASAVECDAVRLWVINPAMTRLLVKLFGFTINSETPPDARIRYSAHVSKWLRRHDLLSTVFAAQK